MAQKVTGIIKLQINAAKATASPPVGPALGQHGINIAGVTKEFNERTKKDIGLIIPVEITVYADGARQYGPASVATTDDRSVIVEVTVRGKGTLPVDVYLDGAIYDSQLILFE